MKLCFKNGVRVRGMRMSVYSRMVIERGANSRMPIKRTA